MEAHQRWLEGILQKRREGGELTFKEAPARLSRLLFNSPLDQRLTLAVGGGIVSSADIKTLNNQKNR